MCRTFKFSGFHSVLAEDSTFLGYDTVSVGKQLQEHVVVSSSKVKMSKNTLTLEDGTTTLCWKVWNNLLSSMALYHKSESSQQYLLLFVFVTYFDSSVALPMVAHFFLVTGTLNWKCFRKCIQDLKSVFTFIG